MATRANTGLLRVLFCELGQRGYARGFHNEVRTEQGLKGDLSDLLGLQLLESFAHQLSLELDGAIGRAGRGVFGAARFAQGGTAFGLVGHSSISAFTGVARSILNGGHGWTGVPGASVPRGQPQVGVILVEAVANQ